MFGTTGLQDHFRETLPLFPFISDECSEGCYKQSKAEADHFKHIQVNSPTHQHWLTFDIDNKQGALTWEFNNCPPPNLVCQNPKNGHAHLLYGLKTPIRTAEDGKQHPQRYCRAVKEALTVKLDADLGYSGFLVKNPLHESWRTLSFETNLYELNDLHDYLDLKPTSFTHNQTDVQLGRNVTLFNELRQWSYKYYRLNNYPTYEQWLPEVMQKAIQLNINFRQPLTEAELKNTARSIAKYCVKNFSAAQFSRIQSARGRKGGRPRISDETVKEIKRLKAEGLSQRNIAKELGLSLPTVNKHCKK